MELCLQNCRQKKNIIITFYYEWLLKTEMTSEIFQLIKDDIPNENTKLRKLISPKFAATIGLLSAGELCQSYGYE